jgi:hypothetical protein
MCFLGTLFTAVMGRSREAETCGCRRSGANDDLDRDDIALLRDVE